MEVLPAAAFTAFPAFKSPVLETFPKVLTQFSRLVLTIFFSLFFGSFFLIFETSS